MGIQAKLDSAVEALTDTSGRKSPEDIRQMSMEANDKESQVCAPF